MKKSLLFLLVAGFALASCSNEVIDYKKEGYNMKVLNEDKVTVTFYKNIGKEELDLNSGLYASGTTTAYKIDKISKNSKAKKPAKDPMRVNYVFDGWHLKENEESLFDFDTTVSTNLILYAHWTQTQEEEFIEPDYVEPSHIDNSIDTLVSISGVLNMPIEDGKVKLSDAAFSRLGRNLNDVRDVLNYKIKSGVELTASYNGTNLISYNATDGNEVQEGTITVQNISATLKIDNQTYENKAANYETNGVSFEDHRIMLAGSSSIENWTDSTEDLKPLTTYNHGIGGTTVEQWYEKLNQRLVYPYSPKIVVYYVGVNNIINAGSTVEFTGETILNMFDDVHAHLPNTHIYYILINDLPGFRNKKVQLDAVNQYALDYEASHDYVTTLDAGKGLLKENKEPNAAYFLGDGLHMSLAGYAIWGKFIKDKLIADLKKNA